ncbi:MAG: hypothetical protein ACLQAT_17110 [Candidatus Binataceae bacterium]
MSVDIPLDTAIGNLQARFNDVRNYSLDPNGPDISTQQEQITEWLTAISKDITILSAIRANANASTVTVSPPTATDVKQLQDALTLLGTAIQKNQAFNNFITAVTAVLGAADTVASSGAAKTK